MRKRQIIFALIVFCFMINGSIFSQKNSGNDLSSILCSAGYTNNITSGDLNEYWNFNTGVNLNIALPFLSGSTGVGLDFANYSGKTENKPDYNTYYIHLFYTYGLELYSGIKINTGLKFGTYAMLFDDAELSKFESNESELAVSSVLKLDVPVIQNIGIYLQSDFVTVFTKKRIKLFNITGGLSYSFDSPKWLTGIID